eukprot:gene42747-56823_t
MPPARGAWGFAALLIAISFCPTSAFSQKVPQSTAACPAAADMDHRHLQGQWRAELQAPAPGAPPATATLQLGPHPELAQSVRGTLVRSGSTAQVSGDVDGGDLTLEESINGTNISATWTGQVVDGSSLAMTHVAGAASTPRRHHRLALLLAALVPAGAALAQSSYAPFAHGST